MLPVKIPDTYALQYTICIVSFLGSKLFLKKTKINYWKCEEETALVTMSVSLLAKENFKMLTSRK